jgi:hypothetical protein
MAEHALRGVGPPGFQIFLRDDEEFLRRHGNDPGRQLDGTVWKSDFAHVWVRLRLLQVSVERFDAGSNLPTVWRIVS